MASRARNAKATPAAAAPPTDEDDVMARVDCNAAGGVCTWADGTAGRAEVGGEAVSGAGDEYGLMA